MESSPYAHDDFIGYFEYGRLEDKKVQYLIRASVSEIIRSDEIQHLIYEGLINDNDDVYRVQDLAKGILAHRFNARCVKRVGV